MKDPNHAYNPTPSHWRVSLPSAHRWPPPPNSGQDDLPSDGPPFSGAHWGVQYNSILRAGLFLSTVGNALGSPAPPHVCFHSRGRSRPHLPAPSQATCASSRCRYTGTKNARRSSSSVRQLRLYLAVSAPHELSHASQTYRSSFRNAQILPCFGMPFPIADCFRYHNQDLSLTNGEGNPIWLKQDVAGTATLTSFSTFLKCCMPSSVPPHTHHAYALLRNHAYWGPS